MWGCAARQAGRLCDQQGARNVATVAPETKRKHEHAAGGTTALDAAGAAREPPPLTRHSPAAEVVLGYVRDQVAAISRYDPLLDLAQEARAAGEDTFTYGLMYQRQACQVAKIEQALA